MNAPTPKVFRNAIILLWVSCIPLVSACSSSEHSAAPEAVPPAPAAVPG
jgi:hypothetical protein